MTSVNKNRATSWVVNALVDATAISTPARVKNFSWSARHRVVGTLMTPVGFHAERLRVLQRKAFGVSPECEITTTSARVARCAVAIFARDLDLRWQLAGLKPDLAFARR